MVRGLAAGAMAAAQHEKRVTVANSAPRRHRHDVLSAAIFRLAPSCWSSAATPSTPDSFDSCSQVHDKDRIDDSARCRWPRCAAVQWRSRGASLSRHAGAGCKTAQQPSAVASSRRVTPLGRAWSRQASLHEYMVGILGFAAKMVDLLKGKYENLKIRPRGVFSGRF